MASQFELSQFRLALKDMVSDNEAALAGCAGHVFKALNPHLQAPKYACSRCGGIISHEQYKAAA